MTSRNRTYCYAYIAVFLDTVWITLRYAILFLYDFIHTHSSFVYLCSGFFEVNYMQTILLSNVELIIAMTNRHSQSPTSRSVDLVKPHMV